MLLGSSFALMNDTDGFVFNIDSIDGIYNDNLKINVSSVPKSDLDGLENAKEVQVIVYNNTNDSINYRLDLFENGTNLSKNIKYTFKLNNDDYTNLYTLSDNYSIIQNKNLLKGESDTYSIKIWVSNSIKEAYYDNSFALTLNLSSHDEDNDYAPDYLINENNRDLKLIDDEYLFVGDSPSNYIWFNCNNNETKGEKNCSRYRIVGVYNTNWENGLSSYYSLKIISDKIEDNLFFNEYRSKTNYSNSYAKLYANDIYYNSLSPSSKNLILNAKWYIGDVNNYNDNLLSMEKKNYTYSKIGLLSCSDYFYNNGWMKYKNILTINKYDDNNINIIKENLSYDSEINEYGFVPAMFLRPDVSFKSGTGTYNDPYELEIVYPMNYGIIK